MQIQMLQRGEHGVLVLPVGEYERQKAASREGISEHGNLKVRNHTRSSYFVNTE